MKLLTILTLFLFWCLDLLIPEKYLSEEDQNLIMKYEIVRNLQISRAPQLPKPPLGDLNIGDAVCVFRKVTTYNREKCYRAIKLYHNDNPNCTAEFKVKLYDGKVYIVRKK